MTHGPRAEMLANRLRKNARALQRWAKAEAVSCYRLFDRDIPEIPLAIDWYDGRLHVAEYAPAHGLVGPDHQAFIDGLVASAAEALQVPREAVFVKRRVRGKGGEGYQSSGGAGARFVVAEHGHRFWVNLSDHLDTGLFLDHRPTRRMVEEESGGRRFLNLFAYTGSFTVHAAAGGARSTTSVDLSPTYCAWARDNLLLNDFTGSEHRVVEGDVFAFLEGERERGARYDLVVLDPPTVSKSKRMGGDLDVQRDHPRLLSSCLSLLEEGGVLYFSTNFRRFQLEAEALAGQEVEDITARTIPPDFRDRSVHRCWRIVRRGSSGMVQGARAPRAQGPRRRDPRRG